MSEKALGLIETIGLAAAIEAADTAIKSANVNLIGYELTKGNGMVTVKIEGDVGAVKAAIEAAKVSASKINKVCSVLIIPRPAEYIEKIIRSSLTVGLNKNEKSNAIENNEIVKKIIDSKEKIIEESTAQDNVEEILKIDEKQFNQDDEHQESKDDVCNICKDPLCPRKKGQPRNLCIHYKKDKLVNEDE
ncbi:BMC domain-containing protein [Caloramator sp. E03]|uniref:BMC domain-containing protein n=1 Tax=Caloramator sp. E03 TaxID=2576307 RepID=UPI001110C458|nr:BMC domain-containing protein [Caloramator sp. E03]QCX34512.1 BMC domain-containing protein [Caloramator sp. E03]